MREDIASQIKYLRTQIGISQNQLARLAGVSWLSIQKIESGHMHPTYKLAKKILHSVGIRLLPKTTHADWALLRFAGVPLMEETETPQNEPINERTLIKQIRLALLSSEPRRRRSLLAFLLAAKMHYPRFYKRLKCDPLRGQDVTDLIKLKRLALARMADIF